MQTIQEHLDINDMAKCPCYLGHTYSGRGFHPFQAKLFFNEFLVFSFPTA